MRVRMAHRSVSTRESASFENAFQNFFHAEREAVGLGHALDFRFAIARAQNRGELAKPVHALVVHLDGDDAFEILEDFLEAVRQRMNVAQMDGRDFFSVFARRVSRRRGSGRRLSPSQRAMCRRSVRR